MQIAHHLSHQTFGFWSCIMPLLNNNVNKVCILINKLLRQWSSDFFHLERQNGPGLTLIYRGQLLQGLWLYTCVCMRPKTWHLFTSSALSLFGKALIKSIQLLSWQMQTRSTMCKCKGMIKLFIVHIVILYQV